MSRKLIRRNVGPGGTYDLYTEDREGIPVKVWVLNETGKKLRERLLKRMEVM